MTRKNFKVLVVDDEPDLVECIIDELDTYSVTTAYNGREALEKIKMQQPDLVISDIKMPEMSGLDCLKEVRQAGISVPFIFLTAFSDNDNMTFAWELGAFDLLEKPINSAQLGSAVNMAFLFNSNDKNLQKNNDYVTVCVDLDPHLAHRLKSYSESLGQSISRIVEQWIQNNLSK